MALLERDAYLDHLHGILRRAWLNLDLVWTGTMDVAGGITLALGLWP